MACIPFIEDTEYFPNVNKNFDELRKQKVLFDIQIKAILKDGPKFYEAHKLVLMCASLFFKIRILNLWREKTEGKPDTDILCLDLKDYDSNDFQLILDYIYTGKIKCTITNVISLYKLSDLFELNSLKSVVIKFMKGTVPEAWLKYWRFAKEFYSRELTKICEDFYADNLENILKNNWMELTLKELSEIIKCQNKEINMEKIHSTVSEYIIKWIQLDETKRIHYLFELTEWNAFLNWDSLSYLHDKQRGFKEYLQKMSFDDFRQLCDTKTRESNKKILFICIREWTYLDLTNKKNQFYELFALLKVENMVLKFKQELISKEKLIYENPKVKDALEKAIRTESNDCLESVPKLKIADQRIHLVSTDTIFTVDKSKECLVHHIPHSINIGFSAIPLIDNNHIFMLSGAYLRSFSTEENTFTQLAQMREPRDLHAMIQYKNKIFSCGGSMGVYANTKTVEEYDMVTDKWYEAPAMSMGRYSYKMEEYNNTILVVGGKGESLTVAPPIEQYDPRKKKWDKIDGSQFPSSSLRHKHFSFLCKHSIYYYSYDKAKGQKFDLRMKRWENTDLELPKELIVNEIKYVHSCCKEPIYITAVNNSNIAKIFEFDNENEKWKENNEFCINNFPQVYTSNLLGFMK